MTAASHCKSWSLVLPADFQMIAFFVSLKIYRFFSLPSTLMLFQSSRFAAHMTR